LKFKFEAEVVVLAVVDVILLEDRPLGYGLFILFIRECAAAPY